MGLSENKLPKKKKVYDEWLNMYRLNSGTCDLVFAYSLNI